MLAEKFMLLLETLKRQNDSSCHPDGSPIVVSAAQHIPVHLPRANGK